MSLIGQELRYALRQLRKSPGFAFIAVLILALGIGANTAIFTVVNAALVRSLPYHEPDRLIHLNENRSGTTRSKMELSYPDYLDFRARNQSFSDVAGYSGNSVIYNGRDGAEQFFATYVTSNFFDVLGVQPILGRTFRPGADLPSGEPAVLLSYAGWQKRFGGDSHALGQSINLNGQIYTIIGILPNSFQFAPSRLSEFFLPFQVSGWRLRRNAHWMYGVGRLKAGITLSQAQSEAAGLAHQLEVQYPDSNPGVGFLLAPLHDEMVGNVRSLLLILMGAVAAVLLITCSNLAGLQLARSTSRQREIAVRLALGASWRQVIRLLLTESLLIALAGGIAGVLLARLSLPILIASLPKEQQVWLPFLQNLQLDPGVLCFSLGVSILAGLAFGLLPAIQGVRSDVLGTLQDGSRTTAGSFRHRLRNSLVISQVAIAIVLLVCAGLLLKSLTRLLNVDPGFNVAHLLTFETSLPLEAYRDRTVAVTVERNLRARLEAVPGVASTATVNQLPLGNAGGTSRFVLAGHAKAAAEEHEANTREISPNYFETMAIPLRAGRLFSEHDDSKSSHVALINQTLADELFPNENPIGKRIDFAYTKEPDVWEIIGVVSNENLGQLDQKETPVIYEPFAQSPDGYVGLVVRTTGEPAAVAGMVRSAVREFNPQMPVTSLMTMDRIIAESPSVSVRRYPAYLIGAFAGLAVILAMLGIYGLLAYVVAQRTRELGIRLALGAQRTNLLTLVIANGLKLTLIGVVIGAAGSLAAGRLLSTFLFEVRPLDLAILLSVATLLVAVSLMASYIPARRAASIEPMTALRTE